MKQRVRLIALLIAVLAGPDTRYAFVKSLVKRIFPGYHIRSNPVYKKKGPDSGGQPPPTTFTP